MHGFHRLRLGDSQIFIASLQFRTAEIISRETEILKAGPRRTVEHQHGAARAVEMIQEAGGGALPGCLRHHHSEHS